MPQAADVPTTIDAFFALPVAERFSDVQVERDGKMVTMIKFNNIGMVWVDERTPRGYIDADGQSWKLGRLPDGVLVRQKSMGFF